MRYGALCYKTISYECYTCGKFMCLADEIFKEFMGNIVNIYRNIIFSSMNTLVQT